MDAESGKVKSFDSDNVLGARILLASAALDGYVREESSHQETAELRIEIDEFKRAQQVSKITDSVCFTDLKKKVQQIRSRAKKNNNPWMTKFQGYP